MAFLMVILLVCLFTADLFADTGIMAGINTGKRRIIKEDVPKAKQDAISDALEQALQNTVTAMVSRDVLARHLGVLYDRLLPKTQDYVVTYKVLAELKQAGHYLVAVESKIDMSLVEKFLKDHNIINANPDIPTILPLISEKTGGEILPRYWWGNNPLPYESVAEDILIRLMADHQILSTANGIYRPDPSFYNITFNSVYDAQAAMALGEQMKADIVAIGSARSDEAPNRVGDEKAYVASVDLDLFHIETREKVATIQVQETAASIDEKTGYQDALIKAAHAAGEAMVPKIQKFWTEYLRKERTIEVTINGDEFLPRYVALKDQLQTIPEIESVIPKELGTNSALLGVVYKGNAQQFASTLILRTFENFGIDITEVTDTSLTVQFVSLKGDTTESAQNPDPDQPAEQTE
ncbi:MAG: hypothetical protein D3926_19735 [Desulfobacteraceae bacterium]|nr:MAG: hypothetical protein D3926_19735 [Desulfobacteraceae bacterium]